ncbi:MAG: shikimate dehydrogenase [Gemmatirosa sp.]|nr:shikimate dehydrogenase [Gemmatirosa sp.]
MSEGPAARPRRLVLLGHPLGHTLSPLIHGAALRSAGIGATYEALDVPPADLDRAIDRLIAEGAAGNVTIPHKPAVFARCAWRTATADRAGAVNTFWSADGALHGENTDVGGFDASVRALVGEPDACRVALIGAGGASAGVATAVERWTGASLVLWGRTPDRVAALADRFPTLTIAPSLGRALADATLVVNATPLGLRDDAFPADLDALPADAAVLDLVYRRGETAWVRAARGRGHRASDGLPMLVEQAALAFERWFAVAADREAMWDAVGGRPAWMTQASS